jgi:hypothetical protein
MAKQSGRRSTADDAAARLVVRIEPTRKLSALENQVWVRVITAWPPDHFISSDAELLTQYCAVCEVFESARAEGDVSAMDKAGRLCIAYARSLRITPQSRYDEKTAARQGKRGLANAPASNPLIGGMAWRDDAQLN